MPVQPTYPGVYIEELPSGVRTIAGVSTSTAVFLGRAKQGPMDLPVLCLSFPDFERTFSSEYADSDLARQVRLFFENGGTRCYVMRIAQGAGASKVNLKAVGDSTKDSLLVSAKSAGTVGDTVRLAVTYRGPQPESLFNLEVFRWGKDAGGNLVKQDQEVFPALSMDPASPRYAAGYVTQSSKLIQVAEPEKDVDKAPLTDGSSQSGRRIPAADDASFITEWKKRLGKDAENPTNGFRISVNGGPLTDVSLVGIDFAVGPVDTPAKLAQRIKEEIEKALPVGVAVKVSFESAGTGKTSVLRIASAQGDVRIESAGFNDLTASLMLGAAQGGLEVSRFANRRPAPNGLVLRLDKVADFAALQQNAFDTLKASGKTIPLGKALVTTDPAGTDPMYKDKASTVTGNNDGVREKLAILAEKVNAAHGADPAFTWQAEVWGSRLAILPIAGNDNTTGTVVTQTDATFGTSFLLNTAYYSLGTSGTGSFQGGGVAGNPGSAPKLPEYRAAFEVLRKEVDLFNLLLLPADKGQDAGERAALWGPASTFCQQQRAFLLIDAPDWKTVQEATHPTNGVNKLRQGVVKDHAAVFYPGVTVPDNGGLVNVGPTGAIAGLMARIDASRGVWKAPAGTEADIRGIVGLERRFSDLENGVLNPRAINTLRIFSSGIVNWGARTLDGDDDFGSQWKYIPVRRLALYIEESLYRGTQWVVFEPNDEPLWAQIRLNLGAFMNTLFRQGAFQGTTPREAYLVKCDRDTTTQDDINRGIVNIVVGFAPLKPAEFVILKIQQLAGQLQT